MLYKRKKNYNPLHATSPNNIDRLSLQLVERNSTVLELGSSSGYLGTVMRQKLHCKVIGVELDKKAGTIARKSLNHVIIGNIEDQKTLIQIQKNGPYDTIFASAIFEHLVDPDGIIKKLSRMLTKNGFFVVTLPNITHYTARLSILQGNFEYTNGGIFDKTHLHFYTLKTAREFLEKNNLKIIKEEIEFFGPRPFSFLFKFLPNLFAYQVVFKAESQKYEH